MGTLTAARNTPTKSGDLRTIPMPANGVIFQGSIVQIAASGYAVKGAATVANVAIGRAEESVDNKDGANGDKSITVRRGIFRFKNSAAADLIGRTEIGKTVFVVDEETVAKTDNSAARPAAGKCYDVDANGVWVEFI